MKQKHIFRALLALMLVAVLAAGGWGLDILINGKHLSLSRESVQEMRIFALLTPDGTEAPESQRVSLDHSDPANREKIGEIISFLKQYRYSQKFERADQIPENRELWTNEGRILYYIEINYQHHRESFQIFPEAIRSVNYSQDSPYALYVAANPEKFREQIDRFAMAVFGEEDS